MCSMACDTHSCVVWFYSPLQEKLSTGSIINKFVATVDGPYCHTELQFPNGDACSITMNGSVRLWNRTFDPCFYTGLRIQSTADKIYQAQKLAEEFTNKPTLFSFLASHTARTHHTYCSKLVRDILTDSDILAKSFYSPTSTWYTPSGLYRHLLQEPNVCFHRMSAKISPIDFKVFRSDS